MTNRILVTGGAGFIGRHFLQAALQEPAVGHITILDDLSGAQQINATHNRVTILKASITDLASVEDVFDEVDSVVHLAGRSSVAASIRTPLDTHAVNATATLQLLETCRRHHVSHIIAASSCAVYGSNNEKPVRESDAVAPETPYALSKLYTEQALLAYQHSYGMSTLPLRFFNVYGPDQPRNHAYAAIMPALVHALNHKQSMPIHGDGRQRRDFVHVSEVVNVLLQAVLQKQSHIRPINLGSGTSSSLLELVRIFEDVFSTALAYHHEPKRSGDISFSEADTSLLDELFPVRSKVSLREGVRSLA